MLSPAAFVLNGQIHKLRQRCDFTSPNWRNPRQLNPHPAHPVASLETTGHFQWRQAGCFQLQTKNVSDDK